MGSRFVLPAVRLLGIGALIGGLVTSKDAPPPFPSAVVPAEPVRQAAHAPQTLKMTTPIAPGMEKNGVQAIPGKGWFVILRLFGPLGPWFEKTWGPSEIEMQP